VHLDDRTTRCGRRLRCVLEPRRTGLLPAARISAITCSLADGSFAGGSEPLTAGGFERAFGCGRGDLGGCDLETTVVDVDRQRSNLEVPHDMRRLREPHARSTPNWSLWGSFASAR
jgi:hypothetical protein